MSEAFFSLLYAEEVYFVSIYIFDYLCMAYLYLYSSKTFL